MERIVVIDHASHTAFIEDIPDDILETYGGDEEKYIKDNYAFDGSWSWDYVTSIQYIPEDGGQFDVEPTELI